MSLLTWLFTYLNTEAMKTELNWTEIKLGEWLICQHNGHMPA